MEWIVQRSSCMRKAAVLVININLDFAVSEMWCVPEHWRTPIVHAHSLDDSSTACRTRRPVMLTPLATRTGRPSIMVFNLADNLGSLADKACNPDAICSTSSGKLYVTSSLTVIDVMLGNMRRSVDAKRLWARSGANDSRQKDVTLWSDGGMSDWIVSMNLLDGSMRCRWVIGPEMIGRCDGLSARNMQRRLRWGNAASVIPGPPWSWQTRSLKKLAEPANSSRFLHFVGIMCMPS